MNRFRLNELRRVMKAKKLDSFLVTSLENIRYLSGFTGSNALLVITSSGVTFLTDTRYTLQSKNEVSGCKRIITRRDLIEEAAGRKLFLRRNRIGFESQHTVHAQFRKLRKLVRHASLVPTEELVETIAIVKDTGELNAIGQAVKITDRVFHEVVKKIRPGVTELDLAAEISYLHKKFGAEKDAFESIVASGKRGSLPHARPTAHRIKKGEFVTLDFGCTYRGYNSDLTRTVAVGTASKRMREMYAAVLHAQREAIAAARAHMPASDLDGIARGSLTNRGYGKYFSHSLGHGLGLHVHERPRVSFLSKESLLAGSVITIEPGIYIPGVGGVRIEDDVVLDEKGCTVLNKAPKELLIL